MFFSWHNYSYPTVQRIDAQHRSHLTGNLLPFGEEHLRTDSSCRIRKIFFLSSVDECQLWVYRGYGPTKWLAASRRQKYADSVMIYASEPRTKGNLHCPKYKKSPRIAISIESREKLGSIPQFKIRGRPSISVVLPSSEEWTTRNSFLFHSFCSNFFIELTVKIALSL